MPDLPIIAKLLRASQLAYDVTTNGPVALRPPFGDIGFIEPPLGFAFGDAQIDAAMIGQTATETIVAFRGTLPLSSISPDKKQVLRDWLNELDALPVHGQDLPGLVHQGFLRSLNALWGDIARNIPADKPIFITGHSKGGALANLAAARWATLNPQPLPPIVTTFAGAKPGDEVFAEAYDRLVPHSVRYEFQDDIVPHLPPGEQFRSMFRGFDVFASAVAKAEARLPEGVSGFVGVGELQFIDWGGAVITDSLTLRFHRYLSIARLAVELKFGVIVADHTLGDEGGYSTALLPANTPGVVVQPVPGVSPVV